MQVGSFLSEELCEVHISATTKKEVLRYSAERLASHPATKGLSAEMLFRELQKRERQTSTGFGNEVAIPHARINGMTEFIAFVMTSKQGVPFHATDGLPVKLFFVLVGPEERVRDHIKILAVLSRTLCKEGIKEQLLDQDEAPGLYKQVEGEIQEHIATIAPADSAARTTHEKGDSALILINVYEEDYLQQVLESLLEYGITGATIIDSAGMGRFLSEAPLFGNFIGFMRQNRYHSKTIIATANSNTVESLFNEIEQNIGEDKKYEIVSLFALPLHSMRGSMSAV